MKIINSFYGTLLEYTRRISDVYHVQFIGNLGQEGRRGVDVNIQYYFTDFLFVVGNDINGYIICKSSRPINEYVEEEHFNTQEIIADVSSIKKEIEVILSIQL